MFGRKPEAAPVLLCVIWIVLMSLCRVIAEQNLYENESTPFPVTEVITLTDEYLKESESGTTTDIPKAESDKKDPKPFLLPQAIQPTHYRLEIIPFLFEMNDESSPYFNTTRFTASGKVWIQLKCLEDSSNVTLHAHKDVKIDPEKIWLINGKINQSISIRNISRDNETDFLILHLAEVISGNDNEYFLLHIEFTTKISAERLNGLYLDYYIDPSTKEKRYLSTTLFAPNHARKAFPCFDEPGFKTNFSIRIGRKDGSGYFSISNMPVVQTEPIAEISGWVWDIFAETIPLPTYLVALITTDFAFRTVKHSDIEIRLYAPEYLLRRTKQLSINDTSFLRATQNPYIFQDPLLFIESALEMWKDTELGRYPLPKLDVIALPHFFFNAMENMGAMTFKYPVILNIEGTTSTSSLMKLNYVAGHEVVHQYFGNMLTPKSWKYVWLKESFSDFFSRKFVSEKLFGGFNTEDMITDEIQVAMKYDSGPDTHPLENHLKSAASVGEIYTDIPYRKGASIVHMTRFFMGEKAFLKGLEVLFQNRKYSNIDQDDLFASLQEARKTSVTETLRQEGISENVTISEILNTWTKQTGYPVVIVQKEGNLKLKQEECQNGLLKLLRESMSQEEDSTAKPTESIKDEEEKKYWWVPVKMVSTVNSSEQYIQWLAPNSTEVEVNQSDLYRVSNVEGYFRILYSMTELNTVLREIVRAYFSADFAPYASITNSQGSSTLSPTERSQLLDDYFFFAFSKYEEVPVSLLFHLTTITLQYEKEQVVWITFLKNMRKPYQLLRNTEHYDILNKYLVRMLKPLHSFLESEKFSIYASPCSYAPAAARRIEFDQFKSAIQSWLCKLGDENCKESASRAVSEFMKTGAISSIPADSQETFYCTAMKTVSDDRLDELWSFFENFYFEEYYSVQRDKYLKGLSCTTNMEYLQRMLSWTTNETLDFHDVDRVTLLKYVIGNALGREIVLDFLDENFDALYKSASVANPVTEGMKALVDYVNSYEKLKQLEDFIEKHSEKLKEKKRSLEKQKRSAKLNILWMELFSETTAASLKYQLRNTLNVEKQACSQEIEKDFSSYLAKITSWQA